jgi:hypothetical protein
MKKLVALLILIGWAYMNPDHFINFWGNFLAQVFIVLRGIFHSCVTTLNQP